MEGDESRTRNLQLRWHFKNVLVIVLSVLLLAYFSISQAVVLLAEYPLSSTDFLHAYIEALIKSTLLVVTLGIMVSLFATQEYQTVFNKLIKTFSSYPPLNQAEQEFEGEDGSRNELRSSIESLTNQQARFKELAYLEYSVDTMISRNNIYRNQLERQRGLLRETFLIQLLSGWFQDDSEAHSIGESLGILIDSSSAQVVVFDIDWAATEDMPDSIRVKESDALLKMLLDEMMFEQFISHAAEIDGYVACLILPCEEDSLDVHSLSTEIFRIVSLVRQIVSEKSGLLIRAAIGEAGRSIEGIAASYAGAIELLDYAKMIGDQGNVFRSANPSLTTGGEVVGSSWIKREMHFLNCVRAEDYGEANAIFEELIASDYARHAPTLELAKHRKLGLVTMLLSAHEEIIRTYGESYVDQLIPKDEIVNCVSLQELGHCCVRMFKKAGYISVAKKSGSSYERMANVTEYILDCFRDQDLNVNSIALQFGLNPSYLSRTFKNMMGIGLFDFVQQLRIKEAKMLMKDADRSIKDIAEHVGFSNALAMNRAFKKHEGTTPSGLRVAGEELPEDA